MTDTSVIEGRSRRGGRSGGREGRRQRDAAEASATPVASPFKNIRNPYRHIEIISADQLESIHQTALDMLEEIGLKVLLPEARALYRAAGAAVDEAEERVRFPREMLAPHLAKAPRRVSFTSRNGETVEVGDDRMAFLTVGGPPNVSDLDRGRRTGNLADLENYIRLAQSFDVVHMIGAPVEPVDVPLPIRHLELARVYMTLSDKPFFIYSRGPEAVADSLEMVRIVQGVSEAEFRRRCYCYTVVNMNSPLQLDVPMSQGIMDMARAGQAVVVTPFTLAGAMAPITLPGALAQQHAEAMAGILLVQLVAPGAPTIYGGFTSNVDMRSGAPAFGTPEYTQAALIGGQLARRLGLPYRSSNTNASNHPDAQSAYESQMSLWGALMGGCNFLLHGAGWLEGGLTASFEKFIIDVEMLQMMASFFRPPEVNGDTLAMEAVREVGPTGHFFGAQHTLARYDRAFYQPLLSDWRNFETWQDDGSLDATQRANLLWKEALATYQEPDMPIERREALRDFMERRKAEGGVTL